MRRLVSACFVVALAAGGLGLAACGRGGDAAGPAVCTHGVLDADCPFCHADLVAKLGECKEHGVPEALCWICKPSLVGAYKAKGDWCGEHGLPESQCGTCHPGRGEAHAKAIAGVTGPAEALPPGDFSVLADDAAPRTSRAPSVTCATEKMKVQLASPETAKHAGFAFETVKLRSVVETLSANAEVAFVPSGYARIASRLGGAVREVRHDVGDVVAAGEVLAVVSAPELAVAKAAILRANEIVGLRKSIVDRERALSEKGLATVREVLGAETQLAEANLELSAAKEGLRGLGADDAAVERVLTERDTSSTLHVVALVAGQVVDRDVLVGEVVDTSKTLFAVADTSTVWAMLDVREADVGRVATGQAAVLQFGGAQADRVAGRVSWISPKVEPSTRTVKVRVALANPSGALRAGAFGTAEITLRKDDPLPAVPKTAVQWEGCCNVAFVRQSDRLYLPRKLRLGADLGDHWAVLSGLKEGDVVVTDGSYLLKTEIRKESIGAGCCAED